MKKAALSEQGGFFISFSRFSFCHSEGISLSRLNHHATTRFLLNDKKGSDKESI
jgi:hypothetical protein